MRVRLDGVELPGPCAGLAEAIDLARAGASGSGRLIVQAMGDGRPIPDEALEHPERAGPAPEVVDFTTADPGALVRDALLDAAAMLAQSREDHAGVVASLDAAELEAARVHLDRVLTAWSACVSAVRDGGAVLGLDLSRPVAGGGSPEQGVARLLGSLTEIRRCVAAEDWAGVSDTVGADLDEQSRTWDTMLGAMARDLG